MHGLSSEELKAMGIVLDDFVLDFSVEQRFRLLWVRAVEGSPVNMVILQKRGIIRKIKLEMACITRPTVDGKSYRVACLVGKTVVFDRYFSVLEKYAETYGIKLEAISDGTGSESELNK